MTTNYNQVLIGKIDKLAASKTDIYFAADGCIYKLGGGEDPLFVVHGAVMDMTVDTRGRLIVLALDVYCYDPATGLFERAEVNTMRACASIDAARADGVFSSYWPKPTLRVPQGYVMSEDQGLAVSCGSATTAVYLKDGAVESLIIPQEREAGEFFVYREGEDKGALSVGSGVVPGLTIKAVVGGCGGMFLCKEKCVMFFRGKEPPRDLTPNGLMREEMILSACECGGVFYVSTNRRLICCGVL